MASDSLVAAAQAPASDDKTLHEMVDLIRSRLASGVVVLAAALENQGACIVGGMPDLTTKGLNAGHSAEEDGAQMGGKGVCSTP